MKKHSKIVQWILTGLLIIWGTLSFIILASEESDANPLPIGQFFLLKAGSLVSLYLCFLTWKWLNNKGLVIEFKEEI